MRLRKPGASLAGWLFADLTLVLFVVSLSSADSSASCPKPSEGKKVPTWCTPTSTTGSTTSTVAGPTTTISTVPGGIRPDPIEIVINGWKSASLAESLDKELKQVYESDASLRALLPFESIKFGVVYIYGGSRGYATTHGDREAERAAKVLRAGKTGWTRVGPLTYIEAVHDLQLSGKSLRFKLFPVLVE